MGDDRMDQGLEKAIGKFKDAIKDLPSDGEERTVSITVGGDNHGSIIVGHHITVNPPAEAKEEKPLTIDELREIVEQGKREARQSWIRNRLNIPTGIMFFLLGLAITGLLNGYLLSVPMSTFNMLLIGGVVIFLAAGFWASRIGDVERGIFQQARQQTLQAKQELQRRRFS
ncbi:hypothetical protein [Halomonas llamarensis]|uniref:Uncharacterized protein n=1 Tax=Halomonas llamarensis TaxID=2945104 RepID=A0ABT0SRM9_9GAMM|nr:hypothetical protein [Halomonas llamarensis]MCL7930452.1 hypothetical protein [Halomonas llamarensis]